MENAITMAELAGVVLGSFSLAGLLEWLCLRGLMQLMPARAARAMNPARAHRAGRELLRISQPELRS
jgi:hypothetical protein